MERGYDRLQVLEPADRAWTPGERLGAVVRPLLSWYSECARTLPWREDPKPYRVWVSEIMLQQTRVEAVKPYFERFMRELPAIRDLAEADEDKLMKLWEGLGYYSRIRNMKKAALILKEHWGGEMPGDYEEIRKLPGIGSYTAGAIASIAFGIPAPAVDGNVLRVVARITGSREDIGKQSVKTGVERLVAGVIPRERCGDFNQALIELGALVCIPGGAPRCGECPAASVCVARRDGLTEELPVKAKKKPRRAEERTVCLVECENRVAIRKRDEGGLLASLYEFPNLEGRLTAQEAAVALGLDAGTIGACEPLPASVHVFSHVEWHMGGYRFRIGTGGPKGYLMADKNEIFDTYSVPEAFRAYKRLIFEEIGKVET